MRGISLVALFAVGVACGNSYSEADSPPVANDGGASSGNSDGGVIANNDGGSGDGATDPSAHALPPAPGPASEPVSAIDFVFAISKIDYGDSSNDAWKTLGYDLDGKSTDAKSTDVCLPRGRGARNAQADGEGGRDNSFGKNILPTSVAASGAGTPSTAANKDLAAGKGTSLFHLKLGSSSSSNPLTSTNRFAGDLAGPPKRDGSDAFPVDLKYPAVEMKGYLVDDVWVSGPLAPSSIVVPFFPGHPLTRAIVTMKLSADRKHATNGVIAGLITVAEAKAAMSESLQKLDPSYCAASAGILQQLDLAADIMADGSQDPTKECDAISIAVAFEAEIALPGQPIKSGPGVPCPATQ